MERLSTDELAAECGTALPGKEVLSPLDLNANVDLLLDLAAPIDLAIGANANIAAPVNAAVDANVLSVGSHSQASAIQAGALHQGIFGNATATSDRASSIGRGGSSGATDTRTVAPADGTTGAAVPADGTTGAAVPADGTTCSTVAGSDATSVTTGSSSTNLLNLDVNGNLHLASPTNGAVAANANAAVPIRGGFGQHRHGDRSSTAPSEQQVSIDHAIHGDATATGHQNSGITQGLTSGDTAASAASGATDSGTTQAAASGHTAAST